MSRQIIYVNREEFDLGDISDLTADSLRLLAHVPEDYDLWRVADWGYREKLHGPMTLDEKVEGRVYLGPPVHRPARFYTAPRFIGNGSVTPQSRDIEDD